jgi:predicted N-acetyltransferase YhbS
VTVEALTVVELAHLDDALADVVVERLASWHVGEWGHLYHPEVWNLAQARREFAEQRRLGGGRPPTTYVALVDGEIPVGSVSLLPSDDLSGFGHLTPWMASLYVDTTWRRRGIGRALIACLLSQPPARSVPQVYLFTAEHASWYEALGWHTLTTTTSGPAAHPVTVMVTSTGAAEDSAPHPHRVE